MIILRMPHLSYQRKNPGLSVLEIVSIVVVVLVLAVVLFRWFDNYRLKSKAAEAQTNLKLIFNAEVAYYENSETQMKVATDSRKEPVNRKQFLPLSPQPAVPKSTPQMGNFTTGDWALLGIKIDEPLYYSYSVEAEGMGQEAAFSTIAKGDLDGDERFSRWEMVGRFDMNENLLGKDIIYSLDPLE